MDSHFEKLKEITRRGDNMKTCKNCYWYDKCTNHDERCEYYDPIFGAEKVVEREYEESLKERAEAYQEIVDEMNDD